MFVGDFAFCGVGIVFFHRKNFQARAARRMANQIDDDIQTDKRLSLPVHRNVIEQAVFGLRGFLENNILKKLELKKSQKTFKISCIFRLPRPASTNQNGNRVQLEIDIQTPEIFDLDSLYHKDTLWKLLSGGNNSHPFLERLDHHGDDGFEVADDAVVGDAEDRGVFVTVDRDDLGRFLHAGTVLNGTADADRKI